MNTNIKIEDVVERLKLHRKWSDIERSDEDYENKICDLYYVNMRKDYTELYKDIMTGDEEQTTEWTDIKTWHAKFQLSYEKPRSVKNLLPLFMAETTEKEGSRKTKAKVTRTSRKLRLCTGKRNKRTPRKHHVNKELKATIALLRCYNTDVTEITQDAVDKEKQARKTRNAMWITKTKT